MMPMRRVSRFVGALYVGVGFLLGSLAIGGVQAFVMHNYDPLWGSAMIVFGIIAMLSIPCSISATLGALLGFLLLRRVACVRVAHFHAISATTGALTVGLVWGLDVLRRWLQESPIQATQAEELILAMIMPFLVATISYWALVKTLIARNFLVGASVVEQRCDSCGYDLRGSTGTSCSECGTAIVRAGEEGRSGT